MCGISIVRNQPHTIVTGTQTHIHTRRARTLRQMDATVVRLNWQTLKQPLVNWWRTVAGHVSHTYRTHIAHAASAAHLARRTVCAVWPPLSLRINEYYGQICRYYEL